MNNKKEIADKITELLTYVNLQNMKDIRCGKLSGGMKRRLGIAQTLLNSPEILLLDEPTAGLDPKERIHFRNLIANLAANRIIILSTHIVSDIDISSAKVIIIKNGSLINFGMQNELVSVVDGKVWTLTLQGKEYYEYKEQESITQLVRDIDNYKLRIVNDTKPHPKAVQITGNLEDLYFYYFKIKQEENLNVSI